MFYEVKVKVERENSKGELKKVAEHYIVDNCELFAEVEAMALEEFGDCDVFFIARSKIVEIVNGKEIGKPFFKATVVDTFTDDDGNEKETKYQMLVCAKDIAEANRIMTEHLRQGYDSVLDSITKTKILDLLT